MHRNTGGRGPRVRSPLRWLGAQAAAAVTVVLLAAACGGGGSSSTGQSSTYQKELAFSQCMRAHGVPNFPDPGSNGAITIQGSGAGRKGAPPDDQRIGGAQMTKANKDCAHLLPNGGVPTAAQRQQMINQALRFTQCMRSHGVPNLPDPSTQGGAVSIGGSGVNIRSPQFQSAQHACQKYMFGKGHGGLQIPS